MRGSESNRWNSDAIHRLGVRSAHPAGGDNDPCPARQEKRAAGEALIREVDDLSCQSWNERMWANGGPVDPTPSIDQASNAAIRGSRSAARAARRHARSTSPPCLTSPPPACTTSPAVCDARSAARPTDDRLPSCCSWRLVNGRSHDPTDPPPQHGDALRQLAGILWRRAGGSDR